MVANFYLKFGAFKKGRIGGQVTTIFTIFMVVMIFFIAITVNIGELSLRRLRQVNAADTAALSLANQLGSWGNFLSDRYLGGGLQKEKTGLNLFGGIVVGALLCWVGRVDVATMVLAGAGVVMNEINTRSASKRLSVFLKSLAKNKPRSFVEIGLSGAMSSLVSDPGEITDTHDFDEDGDTTNQINRFQYFSGMRQHQIILDEQAAGGGVFTEADAQELKFRLAAFSNQALFNDGRNGYPQIKWLNIYESDPAKQWVVLYEGIDDCLYDAYEEELRAILRDLDGNDGAKLPDRTHLFYSTTFGASDSINGPADYRIRGDTWGDPFWVILHNTIHPRLHKYWYLGDNFTAIGNITETDPDLYDDELNRLLFQEPPSDSIDRVVFWLRSDQEMMQWIDGFWDPDQGKWIDGFISLSDPEVVQTQEAWNNYLFDTNGIYDNLGRIENHLWDWAWNYWLNSIYVDLWTIQKSRLPTGPGDPDYLKKKYEYAICESYMQKINMMLSKLDAIRGTINTLRGYLWSIHGKISGLGVADNHTIYGWKDSSGWHIVRADVPRIYQVDPNTGVEDSVGTFKVPEFSYSSHKHLFTKTYRTRLINYDGRVELKVKRYDQTNPLLNFRVNSQPFWRLNLNQSVPADEQTSLSTENALITKLNQRCPSGYTPFSQLGIVDPGDGRTLESILDELLEKYGMERISKASYSYNYLANVL